MGRPTRVTGLTVRDIRFPTSLQRDGSDAQHNPDFSCTYVTLKTDGDLEGYGITFTIGRGNDIVCNAIKALSVKVIGRELKVIYDNFAAYWEEVTNDDQLRWLGPDKGVTHLATAAIMNALWDLWARMEGKPMWKFLMDMEPEKLVSTMDFRYLSDALTKEDVLDILKKGQEGRKEREAAMLAKGYPAYTTSVGWLGYSDDKIKRLCKEAMEEGFTRFKVKVGGNKEDDIRRIGLVRQEVGPDKMVMTDANQCWDVQEAIDWMRPLAKYNITWIEEPTSPDDILGHATIAKALNPLGIGVATGEMCQNRIMFKQFFQAQALQFCQVDSCRLGGLNEILTVIFMAAKFGVPLCPHSGGVGLCELVQHLSIFDYICVSKTLDNRVLEYVDNLHEHFVEPVIIKDGCYTVPKGPGYSVEMKKKSLDDYEFPNGQIWKELFKKGIYKAPLHS